VVFLLFLFTLYWDVGVGFKYPGLHEGKWNRPGICQLAQFSLGFKVLGISGKLVGGERYRTEPPFDNVIEYERIYLYLLGPYIGLRGRIMRKLSFSLRFHLYGGNLRGVYGDPLSGRKKEAGETVFSSDLSIDGGYYFLEKGGIFLRFLIRVAEAEPKTSDIYSPSLPKGIDLAIGFFYESL